MVALAALLCVLPWHVDLLLWSSVKLSDAPEEAAAPARGSGRAGGGGWRAGGGGVGPAGGGLAPTREGSSHPRRAGESMDCAPLSCSRGGCAALPAVSCCPASTANGAEARCASRAATPPLCTTACSVEKRRRMHDTRCLMYALTSSAAWRRAQAATLVCVATGSCRRKAWVPIWLGTQTGETAWAARAASK